MGVAQNCESMGRDKVGRGETACAPFLEWLTWSLVKGINE